MRVSAILPLLGLSAAADAAVIEGRWTNPSRSVVLDIAPCGGTLCGTVAWASQQAQQDARRGTPQLVGTQLLTAMKPKGAIWQGRLFIPDENMRVTAKLQLVGDEQLKVSGCAMAGTICRSQLWNRADGPLPASD
jgi:uncharacterized protein (DUF2147 family)